MKLLWKLYLGYLSLVLLTTLLVGVLVTRWLEHESLRELEQELRAKASLLEELVPGRLDPAATGALQPRLEAFGETHPTRLTVIDDGGRVVADSLRRPEELDGHANRPEVLAAERTSASVTLTRFSHSVGERLMYVTLPVERDGRLAGYVRAAYPVRLLEARQARLRRMVAAGALVAGVVALLPGFLLARRITQPLAHMTDVANAIARGDYDMRPRARHGGDEIATLARSFATMASQLRRRLQTVETEHSKLHAILSSMVEGVVAVDAEERVVHLNDVAARMLEVDPRLGAGHRVWEVVRVPEVCDSLIVALRQSVATRLEVTLTRSPRDQVVELHASPLRDGEGEAAGAVVVLHDVTTLRRLELLRREFVANVSHELKTPLTAMGGLVETLLDDEEMDAATQRRFLGKILAQTERLQALVHDLLVLSRVESEEEFLQREPLDLREPVEESARALRPTREEKEIALEIVLTGDPLPVLGDREALRQVVDNLLDNAVKYTPPGGRVWLRSRRDADWGVVEVEDTGIGLEAAEQERIFERFYRVDRARSRELGGTGLGLSIVKHIVLAHQGAVSVRSTPGKGSAFSVRFPLDLEASTDAAEGG